jgi:RNA polymerase sigma-70 factor (ECF subfamily)
LKRRLERRSVGALLKGKPSMTEAAALLERDFTDEALAVQVARRDSASFALLYDRYARRVYVLAAHLLGVVEAEEIVQDVFLSLWQRADQYDSARGPFAPWFMAVARHRVWAELRRRGRDPTRAVANIETELARAIDPSPPVDQSLWEAERGAAIHRALVDLPAEQRRVLLLAYFGGQSQSQIAVTVGCPLGTVKKRTRLGMQKLRGALRGQIETAPGDDPPENTRGGVGEWGGPEHVSAAAFSSDGRT